MHRNNSFLLRLLVIVNLICWVQCLPSDAAPPEKRVALVIGNSAYQNTPALPNPRNDATEIGKVLKRLGFEVDVQVDLTKSTLDKVLRQFGDRLEGAQVAVFYYAGHGIQVAGTNYLIPVDATLRKEKDLYFEVSELNLVLQQMEGAQRVNLVFLDACRDNPLSKKLAEGMGSGRSTLIGRGLAPMKASDGTMISYATKDGEVASDGKGKHSPYSQAILNHIEAPMEISQMLRKVREDVKKITDNRQTPWEYGSLTGDFYFTGPIKVEISQEPTKSDSKSKMEALYWQSIMNDNDPAVFESYLKKYPDGEFSDLAKIKISNLKKGQKNEILPSLEQPAQSDSKKAYGHLKLTSDPPGASVLLDGSPLGNTDMDASNIEPGKRKIEIQKDCFKVKTAEVMIKAGQQVSMNLKLEPSCGGISATSDPSSADILIDSKPVGITPAEVMGISEGKHQITIRKDGFQDWQEGIIVKTGKTVAVKSGKLKSTAVGQQTAADTAGLPATPQPEYRLTVDSNPADAKIKLLNIPTKYKKGMMLKPGTYQVEISRDGYEPFNTVAEIKDADVTLPISLKEMARGSIRVTSDPSGASVLMDGKKIGVTPLDLADIGPGQKKITVEQNGSKPVTQTASVKSGQQTQLDVRLEAMTCVIKITSDPSNADVYVDDQKSGTTPVELKNISAGSHKIVINKDGYLNFTQTITVEPQKPSRVHAVLIQSSKSTSSQPAQSVSCTVHITSDPSGADVYIDDQLSGTTPVELKNVSAGSRRVVLKKDGYLDFTQIVTAESQNPSQVHFVFIKSTKSTSSQPAQSVLCAVHITSDPSGADVYIDDQLSGTTPVELKNVSAGSRRVVLKKDGYLDFTQTITAESQNPSQVHFVFIKSTKSTLPECFPPNGVNPNADKIRTEAPIGETYTITKASDDTDTATSRMLGCWIGRWGGELASQLIITSISSSVADGYYSWGGNHKGWIRFRAKIGGPGILSWGNNPSLEFIMNKESESIQGIHTKARYDGRDMISKGVFRRPNVHK